MRYRSSEEIAYLPDSDHTNTPLLYSCHTSLQPLVAIAVKERWDVLGYSHHRPYNPSKGNAMPPRVILLTDDEASVPLFFQTAFPDAVTLTASRGVAATDLLAQ